MAYTYSHPPSGWNVHHSHAMAIFMFLVFITAMCAHVSVSVSASASASTSSTKIRNSYTLGFEQFQAHIMNQSVSQQIIQTSSSSTSSSSSRSIFNTRRKLKSSAIDDKTQPIRILFFTEPIQEAIAQSTNDDHKQGGQLLLDRILPSIAQDFTNTIQVEPNNDGFKVQNQSCDGIYSEYIPNNYMVEDYDLVIIVSAFETVVDSDGNEFEWCSSDAQTTLAAATSCAQDPNSKRPIVGLMNVCLAATANQNISNMEEILAHELLHVLAVSEYLFPFYRNPVTGEAMTANPLIAQKINCVNGKEPMNFFSFSSNTLVYKTETVKYSFGREKRGYYEITAPTVRQVVRNQFDCQSLTGARLENQPTNKNSCIGSHFDERSFQFNIMSAIYDSTSVHFTPLTLALLEDSGWYKVDFSNAENSPFGIHSGCDFVEKDCIVQNQVPSYAEGNFCADYSSEGIYRCDPGHNYRGICDLYDYRLFEGVSKPGREYFSIPYVGPLASVHADWCPTVYKYTDSSAECLDEESTKIDGFEFFGSNSKCMNVEIDGSAKALCMKSTCDNEQKQLVFDVQDTSYTCAFGDDGKRIKVNGPKGSVYYFICPKLAAACPDMFCPSMCSGKGICDWDASPYPVCMCNDENDTSAGCFSSKPNDPSNMASSFSIPFLVISLAAAISMIM